MRVKTLYGLLFFLGFCFAGRTYAQTPHQVDQVRTEKQSNRITGMVFDEENLPLVGATITVKRDGESDIYTVTDTEGRFGFTANGNETMLVATYMGYNAKNMPVTAKKRNYVFHLVPDMQKLNEVVVTGMFNRKKEGFTGSAVTISGDDLKKYSTTNVAKALAAVAPGLRLAENIEMGSNPNAVAKMSLRGQSNMELTQGSKSDLLSVQGEYETYPNQPLIMLDGFEISAQKFADLDPERVASVTLLKDAAATAIYGSRASNGVIVVESRNPQAGKLWVSYGGEVRIETPDLTGYNLMNAAEKLDAEWRSGMYTAGGVRPEKLQLYQQKLRAVKQGVDTYWLDKPLRTSYQQRHTLTLEGGDESLRYSLYAGYNTSPGVMKGSKRDVFSGNFNLQYRFKKLLLKNSLSIDCSNGQESPWGSFHEYTKLNPYLKAYNEDGSVPKFLDDFSAVSSMVGASRYANPMYNTTFNSKNGSNNLGITELFSAEYTPNDDWRIVGNFSISKNSGHSDRFRPAQHTAFDQIGDPAYRGDYARTQSSATKWSGDLTVSYDKLIDNTHYITGNTRFSLQESTSESYGALVTGFPNDHMDEILFGRRYSDKMTGLENTSRLVGWVLAAGYSYKYKYSADFNIRLDGSSQFGTDNRWAPFWSAGLRWDVKKEKFLENANWLSNFVLRATYGTTGSQGMDPYQAHLYYSYANLLKPYYSSDATGSEIMAMPNEDLKWQDTHNLNLGLELGFLDGRITARAEYYKKRTNNLVTTVTLAPSLGFGAYPANLGELENKGVEFSASFIPYQNRAKQAYWTITVNGSHNEDKLVKISEAMKKMNEQNMTGLKDKPLPRYEEGRSLNCIWVVPSLGIDPATGQEIFVKRNGKMTGVWDAVDAIPVANTEPDWQGYINSSFTYKGWGADVSFSYRFGGQVYNSTLVDRVENASLVYNADKRVSDLRWQKPGDKSRFKTLHYGAADTQASSRFIMDENVFQWSSLSLHYRMDPQNAPFIRALSLSSAKVAFNMEDIFYLSTVKRERGLDYPFSRRFSVSLNLTF